MPEVILNMLPLQDGEKAQFEAVLPDACHLYAGRNSVTPEQIQQATIIFGAPKPEMLPQAGQLKWLHSMWAGIDEYTAPGVLRDGAQLTSSAGSNSRSVAEHMLASLLALCRKLPQCRDGQKAHAWVDVGRMKTLTGGVVLVVGAGHIGSDFAKLCKGIGVERTIGLKRTVGQPVPGVDQLYPMDMLDELLPQADVVALSLPNTPQTAGLMNRERIGLMKEDAILLNAGRGTVLDQQALAQWMQAGRLWGAALDVTDPEPLPADSPLWDIPNLILTPHVAGGMRLEMTRQNCVQLALENLRRYAAQKPLMNPISR